MSGKFYETALKVTKQAGELIKNANSNRNKKVAIKSDRTDLVTETDQAVEKLLIDNLSHHFPEHKFIGEESVSKGESLSLTESPTWIIDPIDGTMNFVHSFPHSCISLALFLNKKPEIGIIYNPILNQLFTAQKGKGSFLNNNVIKVSGKTSLEESLVILEHGARRDPKKLEVMYQNQQMLVKNVHGFRALGSAALNLSMVACGAVESYFEFGIHIWDIAAGELVVTEAGGTVIDPAGGEIDRFSRRILAASSPKLAETLSKKIIQYYPKPRD